MNAVDRLNESIRAGRLKVRRSGLFGVYACDAQNGAAWEQIDGPVRGFGPCSHSWRQYLVTDSNGGTRTFSEDSYLTSLNCFLEAHA